MQPIVREVGIWSPPGQQPSGSVLQLAGEAGALGGARALAQRRAVSPEAPVAYAHGERHDLWWEFDLAASFRWQGHCHRMNPMFLEHRLQRLCTLFDLAPLMNRRVEDLTPAEQARANLAVALLPQPEVLIWEEPFREMPVREWMRLCRALRRLCRIDGLTVIMVAEDPDGLKEDAAGEHEHAAWAKGSGSRRSAWAARRHAAASGWRWA